MDLAELEAYWYTRHLTRLVWEKYERELGKENKRDEFVRSLQADRRNGQEWKMGPKDAQKILRDNLEKTQRTKRAKRSPGNSRAEEAARQIVLRTKCNS